MSRSALQTFSFAEEVEQREQGLGFAFGNLDSKTSSRPP
jgi:hypothetical protein